MDVHARKAAAALAFLLPALGLSVPIARAQKLPSTTLIRRLPPSSFPALPESFRKQLESRGCQIPQEGIGEGPQHTAKPMNVVRGEFAHAGQTDWAALCETNGRAAIEVFWGKAGGCASELAAGAESEFLEGIQSKDFSGWTFVRAIRAMTAKEMLSYFAHSAEEEAGEGHWVTSPPREYPHLTHSGIADARSSHGFDFLYCSQGQWHTFHYDYE